MTPNARHIAVAASTAIVLLGVGLGSCNSYDLLVHDRFEQADFNSEVDILWVIDDSNSMASAQEAVRANFADFIAEFANLDSTEGEALAYGSVTEATVAFAEYLQNQERFLNYHMGVTTTDLVNPGNGKQGNIRSLGALGGATCQPPAILTPSSDDVLSDFTTLVDVGVSGAGAETGTLAAAFALCKGQDAEFWAALGDLPDSDPVKVICELVPPEERDGACNTDFFRDGAATVVIVVSDEGDNTYRDGSVPPPEWVNQCELDHIAELTFGECDCRISWFLDFFDSLDAPVVFATIGPTYQAGSAETVWCDSSVLNIPGPCNEFNSDVCGLDFYQQMACMTGGLFSPIKITTVEDDPTTCTLADFQESLRNIGALVSGLSAGWRLSMIPDEETITVIVDGELVRNRSDKPSGGWTYVPRDRSIRFSGEDVPGFNARVDIYYYPLHDRRSQVGRNLPF
jgi:hypothetical protein